MDDLDEAIAELDRRGVSWAGDIVESPWYRYRGFHDPEGNLIYITRPDDRALGARQAHERGRGGHAAAAAACRPTRR